MFANSDNIRYQQLILRLGCLMVALLSFASISYAQTTVTVQNYEIGRSTSRYWNPLAIPRFQIAPLSGAGDLAIYMGNGFPYSSTNFHVTLNLDSSVTWTDVYDGVNYPLDHSHIHVYKDTVFVGMNSDGRMYAYTVQNGQMNQEYSYDWNLPLADLYIASVVRIPNSDTTVAVCRGYGEAQIRKSISTDNGRTWAPLSYLANWETAGRCRIAGLMYDNTAAVVVDSADYSIVWFTYNRNTANWEHEGKVFHRSMYRGLAGNVIDDTIRFVVGTINDANGNRDSVICAYRSKNAPGWTEGPAFQTSAVDLNVPPYTALTYIEASKRLVLFYSKSNVANDNEIDIYMRWWDHGSKQWSSPTIVSRGDYSWKFTTAQRVPASHGDVCYVAYPMDSGGYHYADLAKITFNNGSVEDTIPPGKINDLDVTIGATPSEIILDWTAPGDDGFSGTASDYTIKYFSDSIDVSNWSIASSWEPTPIPSSSGTTENTVIQGLSSSQNTYFAVMATDESGNSSEISNNATLIATAVDEDANNLLPDRISLDGNYPNPFNLSTTIEYTLKNNAEIDLSVYDILGRHIKTLVKNYMSLGSHQVHWDGTDKDGKVLPSGVYLYKLKTETFEDAKKLVLMK